jgi:hypothetical protein
VSEATFWLVSGILLTSFGAIGLATACVLRSRGGDYRVPLVNGLAGLGVGLYVLLVVGL